MKTKIVTEKAIIYKLKSRDPCRPRLSSFFCRLAGNKKRIAAFVLKIIKVYDMKKVLIICVVLFAMFVSNAQVIAERCTEEDYNKARMSIICCECLPLVIPNLSPADSLRIDNLLWHLLAAEGFDKSEYGLWWDRKGLQRRDNEEYIVSYGPELKGSGDPVATGRTAFIDILLLPKGLTLFHPKGSIVGDHAVFACCADYIATSEWQLGKPPILHLYRRNDQNALPKEIGQYAPNDFVAEEYYWEWDMLYVKGYEITDELYAGDTIYMRISVEK